MLLAPARLMCCVLTLLAATAAGAAAQEAPADAAPLNKPKSLESPTDAALPDKPKSYSWGMGVVGITQQQPYTGIKRFNFAVPLVYFENRWVQLLGPKLEAKLPDIKWGKNQELSFGAGVQLFGFTGYKPSDAPILSGMAERKNGIFVGPFAKWSNPLVNVTAEWMLDASRNSEGQRVSLGLERSWHAGEHFIFTPSVAATFLDKKYTDYYYGVRNAEARPDRPAYTARSTVNADFGLRTDYMFDKRNLVFGSLQFTRLGNAIKDSPLTNRSSETTVVFGYMFRFR